MKFYRYVEQSCANIVQTKLLIGPCNAMNIFLFAFLSKSFLMGYDNSLTDQVCKIQPCLQFTNINVPINHEFSTVWSNSICSCLSGNSSNNLQAQNLKVWSIKKSAACLLLPTTSNNKRRKSDTLNGLRISGNKENPIGLP